MSFKPQKTMGILGGMGPAAAAEFLRLLAQEAPAKTDQEHPRIIMLSEPLIPDRTNALLGHGESPQPMLRQALQQLIDWGAELLAVPCNTAHCFIDRFRQELRVPLVHIVEETVNAAQGLSPEGAWLLATSGTRTVGIYPAYAERSGYVFQSPNDKQQERVQQSLRLVKAGNLSEAGDMLRNVIEELWDVREIPVVTACTELPLAYKLSGLPPEMEVSSLKALSGACLKLLYCDSV